MSKKQEDLERRQFLAHFSNTISQRVRDYIRDVYFLKSRYIFTTRVMGMQYGYCTHCRKRYRTVGLKQNEKTTCRECGSACIVKQSGISRKYLVDSGHIVFYEKSLINPKAIVAKSMYIRRDYTGDYTDVETTFSPRAMYLFEMGNAQMYRSYWSDSRWDKAPSIYSDFSYSYTGGYRSECPIEWIRDAVTGTPYQYSTWETYENGDNVKFFDLFSRYPCVEYLTKLKMKYFVSAKLNHQMTYGAINWNGKKVEQVLKLSKQQAKEFVSWIRGANNPLTLRLYQIARKEKSSLTLNELDEIADDYDACWGMFQKMLRKSSIRRAHGFVCKQSIIEKKAKRPCRPSDILQTWRDYMGDCNRLGLNLDDESVFFPSNLHRAHQNTVKQVKVKENEILNQRIREKEERRQKFRFQNDRFLIRAAVDTKELIADGRELSHCVGTYAESYANGKCDILVIRKIDVPNKPFFTMEIRNGTIVQCRGLRNCGMTEDVKSFVEAFKAYLTKHNKPKSTKRTETRQEVAV